VSDFRVEDATREQVVAAITGADVEQVMKIAGSATGDQRE
jgi:hypothetical protein